MQTQNALPEPWVGEIFRRLVLLYGRDFLARWEGIDLADVKADWRRQLAGISAQGISHALSTLPPDRPPSVLQFREACLRCPEPAPLALPAPKADPEKVAAALAGMRRESSHRRLAWAEMLRDREAAERANPDPSREPMTKAQRDAWRAALGVTQK